MSDRLLRTLGWVVWLGSLGLVVSGLALVLLHRHLTILNVPQDLAIAFIGVTFATVGGFLADRRPRSRASRSAAVRPDTATAVYFTALEALENVAKYASASRAHVRLAAVDGVIEFAVEDDGRGFDVNATLFGTGLRGIADRLAGVGGTLDVRSAPGQGTTVSGRVPAMPGAMSGVTAAVGSLVEGTR